MSGQKFAWQQAIRDRDHGLTPTELVVVLALALWADKNGLAYPSSAKLAQTVGISERSVRRALTRAEALGWVAAPKGRKGGRSGGARRVTVEWQLTVPKGGLPSPPSEHVLASRGDSRVRPGGTPESGLGGTPESDEEVRGKRTVEEEEIANAISCAAGRRASVRRAQGKSSREQATEATP
jgi:hypothetical protein